MDDRQFDNLVKRLTQTRLSRTDALRGVAASALVGLAGVALPDAESEAKKRHHKKGKRRKGHAAKAKRKEKRTGKDAAQKVTLCHKPGTPAEKTLQVAAPAVEAHLGHGDTLGSCGTTTTTSTTTSTTTTTTPTTTKPPCLPSDLSSTCTSGTQCCSGICQAVIPGAGTTCCTASDDPCDINNPGACCSACCRLLTVDPLVYVCC